MHDFNDEFSLPGSAGEHQMQSDFQTQDKAKDFYDRQMLEYLAPFMQEFIQRQEMVFISTSDQHGECDCSLRSGQPGFVLVIDEKRLAYADTKGNGVMASLGNMSENAHIGMLFIDFFEDKVGLHVNGKTRMMDEMAFQDYLKASSSIIDLDLISGDKRVCWTLVEVEEAYIHCSKNIPLLQKNTEETEINRSRTVDYFKLQE